MPLLPAIPDFETKKKQITDVFIRYNTMFIASDYVFRHINPKIILAEINVVLNYLEANGELQSKMIGSIKKFQRKI